MQAILLAAGRSRRFGSNKLLHPLTDGTCMAIAAAGKLRAALPEVLVVVNAEDHALRSLLEASGLDVSICPNSDEGLGASLAWGVARTRAADGWLIALADMPWIQPATILALASAVSAPHLIAAPVYRGQRGHPVAFGQEYRQALMESSGDIGARRLLERFSERVILLPGEDAGVVLDIDTPEQAWNVAVANHPVQRI